jgi:hypothetical protein
MASRSRPASRRPVHPWPPRADQRTLDRTYPANSTGSGNFAHCSETISVGSKPHFSSTLRDPVFDAVAAVETRSREVYAWNAPPQRVHHVKAGRPSRRGEDPSKDAEVLLRDDSALPEPRHASRMARALGRPAGPSGRTATGTSCRPPRLPRGIRPRVLFHRHAAQLHVNVLNARCSGFRPRGLSSLMGRACGQMGPYRVRSRTGSPHSLTRHTPRNR